MNTECQSTRYCATLLSVPLVAAFASSGCTNPEKANIAHAEKGEVYQYHLGMARKARGDKKAARRALEQAVRLCGEAPFAEAVDARNVLATL